MVGHVGRIIETELGKQLLSNRRCAYCAARGHEYWVYSKKGR